MASLRTEITEVATGLGTLGVDSVVESLVGEAPPAALRNVSDEVWNRLRGALRDRGHEGEFLAAFNNGRALLRAEDGLRGRVPLLVEWKGSHRDPADDAVPADLRIDHVYLISCKYLSKVLHNASPWALFDRCLQGAQGVRGRGDWYREVAPAEHQALYQAVRRLVEGGERLPEKVADLTKDQQRLLAYSGDLSSPEATSAYAALIERVSTVSAARWSDGLSSERERCSMLWRLLRLSATPYFVLGTGRSESLRLRVATPWDWRQQFALRSFTVFPEAGGQPRVGWRAEVADRRSGTDREVRGHVEVRWSHGRLGGQPEAKVYLDTPHRRVPGYFELT